MRNSPAEIQYVQPVDVLLFRMRKLFLFIILLLLFLPALFIGKFRQPALLTPTLDGPSQSIKAGSVTFTGTASPSSTIAVDLDNRQVGVTRVTPDGTWSLEAEVAGIGEHTAMAFAVDENGVRHKGSAPLTFKVVYSPRPLLIQQPETPQALQKFILQGTGTPNSRVMINIDGKEAGSTEIDGRGQWSFYVEPLRAGTYTITAHSIDETSNKKITSPAVTLSVSGIKPEETTQTTRHDGDGETQDQKGDETDQVAVPNTSATDDVQGDADSPEDSAAPPPAESTSMETEDDNFIRTDTPTEETWTTKNGAPTEENVGPDQPATAELSEHLVDDMDSLPEAAESPSPPSGFLQPQGPPEISGFTSHASGLTGVTYSWRGAGRPGSQILISVDSTEIDRTGVDDYGRWQVDGSLALAPGRHLFAAAMLDENGETLAESEPHQLQIPGTVTLENVRFEKLQDTLLPEAKMVLDEVAAALASMPDVHIIINGHTDWNGRKEFNQRLSEKRAETVRQYLIERGIAASRLTIRGYGETKPLVDNSTPENRRRNRRVELVLLGDNIDLSSLTTLQSPAEAKPQPIQPDEEPEENTEEYTEE